MHLTRGFLIVDGQLAGERVCVIVNHWPSRGAKSPVRVHADVYKRQEVHIRIACPPLIYSCPFVGFTASKSDMELITRRVIKDVYKRQQ